MKKKLICIVLDGWGIHPEQEKNAIFQAKTFFFDQLKKQYPYLEIETHGTAIGLPEGQMGNSEVGHLTLGAGRKIEQELVRLNQKIASHEILKNKNFTESIKKINEKQKKIHILGLFSSAGVHSHTDHLLGLLEDIFFLTEKNVFLHLFSDGRDTDPKNIKKEYEIFIKKIEKKPYFSKIKIASLIGRFYAMDRDQRFERTQKAYDLWVKGIGESSNDLLKTIENLYEKNTTDEFFPPIKTNDFEKITNEDLVLCFNFRTDRCRQLCIALSQEEGKKYGFSPLSIDLFTLTLYDEKFKNIKIIFEKEKIENTLGEKIEKAGLTQLRAAETEKYPHVTYFFSGGRENPFKNETRILVPSPKVNTYDLAPEMSAKELTKKVIETLQKSVPDFVLINYANADMVGHTGVFSAIVKAIETVDICLNELVQKTKDLGYEYLILADHGNAEETELANGNPHTAHTTNPVPLIWITEEKDEKMLNNFEKIKNLTEISDFVCFLLNIK